MESVSDDDRPVPPPVPDGVTSAEGDVTNPDDLGVIEDFLEQFPSGVIDLDRYEDPEADQIPPRGMRWTTPDGREPRWPGSSPQEPSADPETEEEM